MSDPGHVPHRFLRLLTSPGRAAPVVDDGWRLRRLSSARAPQPVWLTWHPRHLSVAVTTTDPPPTIRRQLLAAGYQRLAVSPAGHCWARPRTNPR